jgi:hypothetical protein
VENFVQIHVSGTTPSGEEEKMKKRQNIIMSDSLLNAAAAKTILKEHLEESHVLVNVSWIWRAAKRTSRND